MNENYFTEHVSEIDSTNEELKRRFTAGDEREQLLAADFQSAGKGRNGRSFYSPHETGIYFSYLYPNPGHEPVADMVFVTTVAAVLVCEAVREITGTDALIKWVNDVYAGGKKVCGILCEAAYRDGNPGIITGIGINLSTNEFPDEIKNIAGGLGSYTEEELSAVKERILRQVGDGLHTFFANAKDPEYRADILKRYKKYSLVIGKNVSFYSSSQTAKTGLATDILEDGSLVVETPEGKEVLNSGEIHLGLLD